MTRRLLAMVMAIVLIVSLVPNMAMLGFAVSDPYYDEFGITYEQLFTTYPNYLKPKQETAVVNSLMDAYKAALGEYGGDHDFLPSFIYALDQGGKEILSSEILGSFGIGKTTEEKLIAETSEALMREILKTESEFASVTSEISSNFKSLKSTYNIATSAGRLVFIKDLKASCKNLSNSELDKLADSLFKQESKLMSKVGKGIEFWQLIVGIVELQELQEESICQLRDAMEDNSDFAKALDDLLAEIEKDPVAYMLEYYCTDIALELLSDAIETAYLAGRFAPSKLTVAVANIAIKMITTVYPGAMADEIYQTTLLSSYVSEFDAAITSHRTQFVLAKVQGELIGRDDIAEYKYLYNAYITTIRETLKSALDTAKTDGQRGNIQKAIDLCEKFTYDTYIQWCMTTVKTDIEAGIIAAPGSVAGNASACVKGTYPAYGTVTITKDDANIMDRPCSVNTDVTAKKIESGELNAAYTVTGLCLNTADNYWYQIVTKSGETGYIFSGNCEHRAFLQDVTVTGLDVPTHISVGSRYYIRGTISTVYTNLTNISYIVYDDNGNKRTGGTVDVSGKTYVLDSSAIDAAAEFNLLEAGIYHCVLEATVENYTATDCIQEKLLLDTTDLVVGNINTFSGSTVQAESASFISRSDGVWLWPTTYYAVSDWAGCNASPSSNSYCYFCGVQHGLCGANHLTTLGHNGVDIPVGVGSEVYAVASGILYCTNYDWPSRGITAVVEHPIVGTSWSYYSIYQHLQSTVTAKNGSAVAVGEVIAWSGNTDGYGTGQAHLHFGIVMAASGQGNALAQAPNSNISAIENCGWITTSGYATGRILPNPALNSPAGNPTYTDGCESNVRAHAGSVMYTFNKAEVTIGGGDSVPVCAYDVATGGVNSVYVRGWAYDPDTPDESVQIQVYIDGVCIGSGIANTLREDVNAVYGCGNYHGFDITVPATVAETGTHSIEVYALNTNASGDNKYLGHKDVTITAHTHSYTESVTKEATCTQDGIKTYSCESCSNTYTEEIPATGHNYIAEVIGATCTIFGQTIYTCSKCGDSYIDTSAGWSEWSTEYPADVDPNLIEQKTQYSTLEKEHTTSTSDTLDGWTNIGTTYGDWGAAQTTTVKPTESDTLRITNTTQTGWGYYHWCSYYDWTYCVDSIQVNGASQVEWHGYTSSFELPAYTIPDMGGQQSYGGNGNGAAACSRNFYIWFRNPDADVYTYTYQTREKINQFYKWSDEWSEWSDDEEASTEERQVKTQTVYRYFIGELADHNYSYAVTEAPTTSAPGTLGGICTVCNETVTVSLPKLNAADYSYTVKQAPTDTATGIGCYTWKTTTYGTVSFEVILDKVAASGLIVVQDGSAAPGGTITLTVELKNNPGFAYLAVTPVYDTSVLTLVSVENGEIIEDFDYDTNLTWSASENSTGNGLLLKLTFAVAEDATEGKYVVDLKFREAYTLLGDDVAFTIEAGTITVSNILYGDANGDGIVNGKDVLLLRRYMANYDYDTGASSIEVYPGGDANGDGVINGKDVLLMRRYMANYDYDTGMSTIILGPN